MIFNWVVHITKCMIPCTTFMHIKRLSHALVEKNTVRTQKEELVQTREGSFQHSTPTRDEHLTLA